MNVINDFQNMTASVAGVKNTSDKNNAPVPVKTKQEYKPDVIDFLSSKVVNQNDINDMVTMPRAIFKGYLCFTAGTAVNTIAGMIKQGKAATAMKIAGCLTSLYGTYNFVKPYLIKEDLTKSEK